MGARAEEFRLVSSWSVDATGRELLALMRDPLSLASWWSAVFLRAELIEPGGTDLAGLTVRLHTKGFLPHSFQFVARVARADPHGGLTIETWGDFEGLGTVELRRTPAGVVIGIVWRVRVRQPYLRPFLRLLKPVFAANHRWAMRRGREGLEAEIRRRRQGLVARPGTIFQTPTFPHNLELMRRAFRWTRHVTRCGC